MGYMYTRYIYIDIYIVYISIYIHVIYISIYITVYIHGIQIQIYIYMVYKFKKKGVQWKVSSSPVPSLLRSSLQRHCTSFFCILLKIFYTQICSNTCQRMWFMPEDITSCEGETRKSSRRKQHFRQAFPHQAGRWQSEANALKWENVG